ncbi:MFS transporter [Chloroflexus sp.]|uniref:MFS transporter n=1 Tax=Chloroflexus sp. TaxID=1904827 RepID=UPI0026096129|nr:MFS transporter [uncultured Chloroflexus sp.]
MTAEQRYLTMFGLLTGGLTIGWLFATIAYAGLGYDNYRLSLPLIGELTLIGLLNSAPVLAGGISGPLAWYAVGRLGARSALLIGCLLHAAALLTLVGAPSASALTAAEAWLLVSGIAVSGPASVLINLAGPSLMMQLSGAHGPDRLFARSAAINLIISGLGNLFAGTLSSGWQLLLATDDPVVPYRWNAGLSMLMVTLAGLPLIGLRPSLTTPVARDHSPGAQLRDLWQAVVGGLPYAIAPFLLSLGAALFIPYLGLFFRRQFDAPDLTIGLIFAIINLSTGLATLAGPRLARLIGRMQGVVLTQAMAIPCLIALAFAPSLPLAAAIAIVRSALMNMASPLFEAQALSKTAPDQHATVIGLIRAAASVGYITGPTISAEIQRVDGFTPVFLIAALCYTAAVLANTIIFLWRRSA